MIKTKGVYNQALMLRLSFGMSVSKHICNTLIHKGLISHYVLKTLKQSHTTLFSRSYHCFSSLANSNFLTKAAKVKEVSLYNNRGGGYGPSNDWKRAYPLYQFLFLGNKKPKVEFLNQNPQPYPQNKLLSRRLTKLLVMGTSFLFLKTFQNRIVMGLKLRQRVNHSGSQ